MKIKFRNYVIDTEKEPVVFSFGKKDEKIAFAEMILQSVVAREKPEDVEENTFLISPTKLDNADEFKNTISNLNDPDERFVRYAADFDNYKKRMQRDISSTREEAKLSTLMSIVNLDNELNIAFDQIKCEEDKKGITLIINKVSSFLKTNNIEPIQTTKYDPDLHEVISVIENGNVGSIISVVSKGYKMGDKIIKHPQVIIGK